MSRARRNRGVAIVGMSCLFPGAADVGMYWRNIVGKVDAIGDPPAGSDADVAYDACSSDNDRVYCKRGGYLGELARFDPLRYGVMPNSVDGGEPDQFLALRVAYEAMADAGYLEREFDHDRAEVIIGRGTYINRAFTNVVQHGLALEQALALLHRVHPEHTEDELALLKRELKAGLPPFNADMAAGLVPNVMSGRIANRLDLRGANYTIDAACASSLVAVDSAMQDLHNGRCDLALVGGVHCSTPAPILMIFCQLGALSRSGTMRPFDRRADGTLLGEGAGFLVLRRLPDAERDGDRIYATIRGVGVASDGRGLGMLAPRVEGEVLALQRAYAEADVDPRSVGLLEAHGTGTPVGDATEISALEQIFGERDGSPPFCALGCVKSMISHLIPAAGIAGIIKVALALEGKVLPPSLHCEEPNPDLGIERTPFYLNTETRPWVHGGPAPRRAGVDAFGFGGINAHAVLEEHIPAAGSPVAAMPLAWDAEVLVIEAQSRPALIESAERVQRMLSSDAEIELRDLAATLNCSLSEDPATQRLAIVASGREDACDRLASAVARLSDQARDRLRDAAGAFYDADPLGTRPGALAFVFPGEGSQYPGMLADLCLHFDEARECFDAIDRTFAGYREGPPPSAFVFPAPGYEDVATERLLRMDGAGESLFAADRALFAVLSSLGIRPDAMVGHSSGEYAALLSAAAVSFGGDDELFESTRAINALYARIQRDGGIPPAGLAAVASVDAGLVAETVRAAGGELFVAMDNCPHQLVLSGSQEAVDAAVARLRAAGGVCTELPFDRPYHTPLFERFAIGLAEHFAQLEFAAPQVALWSCATATEFPETPEGVRDTALAQWSTRVRFRETVEAMYEAGVRIFVECGPRGNLSAFVDDTLRRRRHLAIATDARARSGLRQLCDCLAQLAVHHVPVDFAGLYRRRGTVAVELDNPRPSRPPDPVPRLASALPRLDPDRVPAELISAAGSRVSDDTPAAAPRPDVLEAHQQIMERFLDSHRNVMQAFLTGAQLDGDHGGDLPALPAPSAAGPLANATLAPDRDAISERQGETAAPSPDGLAHDRRAVEDALRALISERTGYPPTSIESRLNLEADLGVDSIKRVEILETYRAQTGASNGIDLDQLARLRTIEELADAIAGSTERDAIASSGGHDAAIAFATELAAGPLITTVDALTLGEAVSATCQLDLAEHLFLRDHTLESGPIASRDEDLVGLPILPLTFSIELTAEVAALLFPAQQVVAIRDVRATRWVTVPDGKLTLVAEGLCAGDRDVRVELRERESGEAPVLTAVVEFSDDRPSPQSAEVLELADERRSRWVDRPLYGGTSMFHGPAFQAVRAITRSGADGIEATLTTPSPALLLRSESLPAFLTDPVLLDAMGQVVAYWVGDRYEHGVNIFPFKLARLVLHAPVVAPGTQTTCRVRVRAVDDHGLRSDVELVGPDGVVIAAMTGWEDRRIDLPGAVREFFASPRDLTLSRRWAVLSDDDAERPGHRRTRIVDGLSSELLDAQGGIWLDVIAYAILGRAERERWRELRSAPAKRRQDWLRGRIAAKDAVREIVAEHAGIQLCAADVEIGSDDAGCPRAVVAALPDTPLGVTISHTGQVAVALAGLSDDGAIGIDIETARELVPEVIKTAFAPGEVDLLRALPEQDSWPVRLWCVKEAAGKAAGVGLEGDPRAIEVLEVDQPMGTAAVAVGDAAPVWVQTGIELGLVYAACVRHSVPGGVK